MSETKINRAEIVDRVKESVASGASDEAALDEVVRLLCNEIPAWDWVGFYLMSGGKPEGPLVLGPYAGEHTDTTRIEIGDGVCGTAVAESANQIVEDVRELDNYIACSLHTRAEIVVLIRHEGGVVGQFDLDSDTEAAFTEEDEAFLEKLGEIVAPRCASLARTL